MSYSLADIPRLIAAGDRTTCILWPGRIDQHGYGRSRGQGVHRVAYQLYRSEQEIAGLHVHHVCGSKACINPDHLEAIAPRDHGRLHGSDRRTHCVNGHPFTPENTYIEPAGWQRCRACGRANSAAYARRRRELAG